jgi:hypothetical protein
VLMASAVLQNLGLFFPVCFVHHKSAIGLVCEIWWHGVLRLWHSML